MNPFSNRDKIKELTTLNLIMLMAMSIGALIGWLMHEIFIGIIVGMLAGFLGRAIYLHKKYREYKS